MKRSMVMNGLRGVFAATALVGLQALPVQAETVEIVIKHLEEHETDAKPALGDTVVFDNRSEISHNLYLTYEDGTVETLNTQPPGTKKSTVMNKLGHVTLRCWIHPIIHMEFDVTEKK